MSPLKVAYQGVPGAYSEKATRQLLGSDVDAIGYPSFEEAFEAVQNHTVDYGMLPIENSLGGSIHRNYDLLMRYELHILAELDFHVRHSLLVLPGVGATEIERVISHPQALAQCDNFIREHGWKACPEFDTAGSAEMVQREQWRHTAAIASDLAAHYYQLEVLEANIEDDDSNFTRFLLLGRKPLATRTIGIEMKTSLVLSFGGNKTGQLYKALSAFSLRDIDLTKMESRPQKEAHVKDGNDRSKYKYLFYVDFVGHQDDQNVQHAINHLREFCLLVRVFGSYPTNGILMDHVQTAIAESKIQQVEGVERTLSTSVPSRRLKIGIIGFGNFGQFLAQTFSLYHDVYATSRTDYSGRALEIGVTFTPMFDLPAFFRHDLDVVVLCMSILSFEKVTKQYVLPHLLAAHDTKPLLVVDVLSVKKHPKEVLQELLPSHVDILCTHPMFGPESGKHSWRNLPMMYEKVRCSNAIISEAFLGIFEREHCRMIEMTCEAHDEYAASSQFITHLTGRVLGRLELTETPIDTTGFTSILRLVDTTCKDSYDLFYGLYKYNTSSIKQIEKLRQSLHETCHHLQLMGSQGSESTTTISTLVKGITPSKTVMIHALTKQLEGQGIPVVSLCVGEPDFMPHEAIMTASKKALDDGCVKYTGVSGTEELRRAIVDYLQNEKQVVYETNEILVSNGGKQAVYQGILSICEEGDQVIVPSPFWVSYPEIVRLAKSTPVILPTTIEEGYLINPEILSQTINPMTKALVLCNPSNPTGAIHSKEQLMQLAEVLNRPENKHVYIIADEIYEQLTYDTDHVCFASLPGMRERTLLINGFSKAYAMTGYRLGYLAAPREIVQAATILQGQITSCASSIAQKAAVQALTIPKPDYDSYHAQIVAIMREKRDFAYKRLCSMPGIQCCLTEGAFYLFPNIASYFGSSTPQGTIIEDSEAFCVYLLERFHTAIVPGTAFGEKNAIRIAYATSMGILTKALSNLETCLQSLESPE